MRDSIPPPHPLYLQDTYSPHDQPSSYRDSSYTAHQDHNDMPYKRSSPYAKSSPSSSSAAILPPAHADVTTIFYAVCLSVSLTLTLVILFIYFRKKGFLGRIRSGGRRGYHTVRPLDGGRWSSPNTSSSRSTRSFSEDEEERESFILSTPPTAKPLPRQEFPAKDTTEKGQNDRDSSSSSSSLLPSLYTLLPTTLMPSTNEETKNGEKDAFFTAKAEKGREEGQGGGEEEDVESNASEKLAKVAVDQDLSFWEDEDDEEEEGEEAKKMDEANDEVNANQKKSGEEGRRDEREGEKDAQRGKSGEQL
ncbi:thrombospondin type 1 domain-containing protein [Cystoisospora suis]|uniref:Thrombospondin type 1 domain-containing protein n=1 Tax=Cystoisospora suis TaxID=483139 RepID=A0A2C6J4P7_9APIC|nr:thrombospondin type 1 domain-containing protein [Cystoisospora suis]